MHCKLIPVLAVIISAFTLTACDSGKASMLPKETNVLGIVKHEPQSYSHVGPNTFAIHTDELYTRKDFSGDKTTLFWGLVTIQDY
jgi:hypothetical protein